LDVVWTQKEEQQLAYITRWLLFISLAPFLQVIIFCSVLVRDYSATLKR